MGQRLDRLTSARMSAVRPPCFFYRAGCSFRDVGEVADASEPRWPSFEEAERARIPHPTRSRPADVRHEPSARRAVGIDGQASGSTSTAEQALALLRRTRGQRGYRLSLSSADDPRSGKPGALLK